MVHVFFCFFFFFSFINNIRFIRKTNNLLHVSFWFMLDKFNCVHVFIHVYAVFMGGRRRFFRHHLFDPRIASDFDVILLFVTSFENTTWRLHMELRDKAENWNVEMSHTALLGPDLIALVLPRMQEVWGNALVVETLIFRALQKCWE